MTAVEDLYGFLAVLEACQQALTLEPRAPNDIARQATVVLLETTLEILRSETAPAVSPETRVKLRRMLLRGAEEANQHGPQSRDSSVRIRPAQPD